MNKLAYDLALLCVEHGMKQIEPETCEESIKFAIETFVNAYNAIVNSSEPFIHSFGEYLL